MSGVKVIKTQVSHTCENFFLIFLTLLVFHCHFLVLVIVSTTGELVCCAHDDPNIITANASLKADNVCGSGSKKRI